MKTWQVICICVAASLPRCGRSEETPVADSDQNQPQAFAQGRRTWTDDTGKFQIEAMLLGFSDGTVSLEKGNGQVVRFPVERLSVDDQRYVETQMADERGYNGHASPDDKEAVAALKRLGARMTLDDAGTVTTIRLSGSTVTDAALVPLEKLAALRELWLYRTNVTGAGLVSLQRLPNLRSLALLGPDVTDAQLADVSRLTRLESLYCSGAGRRGITDAGLQHLTKLRELKSLKVSGKISDSGLVHLKALENLESLNLSLRRGRPPSR